MERPQPASLRSRKQQLRQRLRALRAALAPQDRAARSQAICARIVELPEWADARVVALFHAIPGEVDLSELWQRAPEKTLLWPVVVGRDRPLEFRVGPPTVPGPFGILEPAPGARCVEPAQLDLVVLPGLGFDAAGRRLGQGGGFYDRTLAHTAATRLAVCFRDQVVREVPTDSADLPMDLVVHEGGVLRPPRD